ncbi:hypothetical protein [Pelagibius sp.]|uniref:hypothetical protein n=1 Tax=Pelagibius sp. TaxID=1931238 RepID=UPI002613A562|nr:hypothetical protein [Pelagibius sp.]
MVMVEPMAQPEPKPEEMRLAEVVVTFSGSISHPQAKPAVNLFAQQATRILQKRPLGYSFPISDEQITITGIHIELERIEDGSIVAKLLIAGNLLFMAYTGVASYPSFKEAIPVIQSDIEYVLKQAAEHFDIEGSDLDVDYETSHVVLFREEDLEVQLENLKGRKH